MTKETKRGELISKWYPKKAIKKKKHFNKEEIINWVNDLGAWQSRESLSDLDKMVSVEW